MAPSLAQELKPLAGQTSGVMLLESKPTNIAPIESLSLEELPADQVSKRLLAIAATALGPVSLPIYAYRSSTPGPVVGITCAIHGNEVNGIAVIRELLDTLSERASNERRLPAIKGTIIGVPVVNVPGFLSSVRSFDGQDLNRLMPGKQDGAAPQQYAFQIFHKVILKFDYLFDLHTASAGRQNSLYVRADMTHPEINQIAYGLRPQVIVHNDSLSGSMRGCAQAKGIKAVTVEIDNPSIFQNNFIAMAVYGMYNVLTPILGSRLLQQTAVLHPGFTNALPVVCCRSYWIFSHAAGILQVHKKVAEIIKPGELIAEISSIFGEVLEQIFGPPGHDTVVVGFEANPVAKTGNRMVHLGVLGTEFKVGVCDGHL